MNPYPTLAELSLIARSLPPFASNDRTGDQRVAVYVYRGHAWIETNGDPTGIEDDGAGALADECGVTLDEVEQARAASARDAAMTAHEATLTPGTQVEVTEGASWASGVVVGDGPGRTRNIVVDGMTWEGIGVMHLRVIA